MWTTFFWYVEVFINYGLIDSEKLKEGCPSLVFMNSSSLVICFFFTQSDNDDDYVIMTKPTDVGFLDLS